jgi:nicotinamidase-related amidase
VRDALIVIDVLSRFDHEDGGTLLASFRERLPRMTAAIDCAREGGLPVIYVNDQDGHWDSDANRLIREARAGKGGEIARQLGPGPGDAFLVKCRYSIFDHTPLELLLADLETERLLLMGATTEGCVLQSGIDGREHGFKTTILAEACATIDPRLEEVALSYAAEVGGMRVDRSR